MKLFKKLGCLPDPALLVAAHGWDVTAGLQGAFITRPGQPMYSLAPAPGYQALTSKDLAQQLLG